MQKARTEIKDEAYNKYGDYGESVSIAQLPSLQDRFRVLFELKSQGVLRVQFQGFVKRPQGLLRPSEPGHGHSKVDVRFDVAGVQLDRFTQLGNRAFQCSLLP